LEEATKLVAALVLGAIYSLTPLRELSNGIYHLDVNENISRRLTKPFEDLNPQFKALGWSKIRHIFYHFVDKDETLKVKSQIVRFNGLMWTSLADLRVVSVIGVLAFSASTVCSHYVGLASGVTALTYDEYRAGIPIFLLTVLFLLTFYFSRRVTNRHKALGDEQCEYILTQYKSELRAKLAELAAK
jgi:hypothetical protein